MTALLEIAGLHAHYDKSHILHGVHLSIRAGETVSLLAPFPALRGTGARTQHLSSRGQPMARPEGGRKAGIPSGGA